MSFTEIRLARHLLEEHFGTIVSDVCTKLIENGPRSLKAIVVETSLKPGQVRKSLCVLIQHNLVTHAVGPKLAGVEYRASLTNVLLLARIPHYVYTAKTLYGDLGEGIVEEVVRQGQMTSKSVIDRVMERWKNRPQEGVVVDEKETRGKFDDLVNTGFLQPQHSEEFQSDVGDGGEEDDINQIFGKRKRANQAAPGKSAKKPKLDPSQILTTDDTFWCVNYDRFHQHMRDQSIIETVNRRYGRTAGILIRTLLQICEVTSNPEFATTFPVSFHELYQALSKDHLMNQQSVRQHLKMLNDDQMGFMSRTGDSGGGIYVINLARVVQKLCITHIESVVQERFGSKSYRIFKLLLKEKCLEQKQVEEVAMIPAKECKELLYKMLAENFVHLQEVAKMADYAPSRTFYLFSVNVTTVTRMLLQRCYKTLANLISRRIAEKDSNRRLLEKSQKIEAIITSLRSNGEQQEDVEEMLTEAEKAQLDQYNHQINKLEQSEIQLTETIFIFQYYIDTYSSL